LRFDLPDAPSPPSLPVWLEDALAPINYHPKVIQFAEAIAFAEGYGRPGAIPTRINNPGDLKIPGRPADKSGHTIFATPEEGWAALYRQVELMRTGRSRIYKPSMTFREVSKRYAEWHENWLRNVTWKLGVSPDMTLQEFFEGAS
jgi:hypothetical protein